MMKKKNKKALMVDREEEDGRRYVNFGVAEEEDEVLSLQVVSEEG